MMRKRVRWTLIAANLAGLAALATYGGWDILQVYTGIGLPERDAPPMELVAHRGDLDHFPENTLEGIVAATSLPVDGIEFDVIMSADGTWWVMHDEMLDRTTDRSGWIPELADGEIGQARIDGGIGFDPDRHVDLRVPTLSETLKGLDRYPGRIYVDVQHAPTGDVDDVVSMLTGRRAAILCRDLSDSRRVKRLDPSIGTFLRMEDGPADGSVDGWLMAAFFEATAGTVQASDLPVITFVEEWRPGRDETPLIRRAWALGVRTFLTKQPALALASRSDLAIAGEQ